MLLKGRWLIITVLLLSAGLRFYKIDANLPNTYWHDENNYVETALRFGTGNFRPHTLQHGMLLPIILFGEYGTYYLAKKLTGVIHVPGDFLNEYIRDATNFYLISRITVALFGIACVLLIYLIGLRLYNRRVANLSSLLFSLSLVPLLQARYTKASTLSVFFLLLALLALTPLLRKPSRFKKSTVRHYIIPGLLIGLAAAAKLYAFFGFIFVFLAHLFNLDGNISQCGAVGYLRHSFDRKIILSGIFLIMGFLLGNPYAAVNPRFFFTNISGLHTELYNTGMSNTWLLYFTDHLNNVLGSRPLEILILIACAFFVFRRSKKEIILVAYPLILLLVCMRGPGFAHYLIPAVPFLVIIASAFLDQLFRNVSRRKADIFIAVILFTTLWPPFLSILRFNALISKPDTRTIAKDWIEKNIPEDSLFLMEGCISTVPIQVPQLKGNLAALKRDLAYVAAAGGKGNIIKTEIKCVEKNGKFKRYDLHKTRILDAGAIRKIKPDYVVLSGYVDMNMGEREYLRESGFYEERKKFYAELEKKYRLMKTFTPHPKLGNYFPLLLIDDFKKLRSIDLFKDSPRLLQGAEVKIFCRKDILTNI